MDPRSERRYQFLLKQTDIFHHFLSFKSKKKEALAGEPRDSKATDISAPSGLKQEQFDGSSRYL